MSDKSKAQLYLTFGIIGACILLYGYLFYSQYPQPYYVIGSLLLLLTAIHYKLLYFIALELILVAGHLAILLGTGPYTQAALPILLTLQLLVFYLMVGKNNTLFLLIGIVGIALLSMGFSYHNQWLFFSGSFFTALYAYYNGYKVCRASYLWAVLNTIFVLLALYQIV